MIRQKFRVTLIPAIVALAFVGAGCDISVGEHGFSMDVASGKATDEWKRTYTIAAGGTLEIDNVNGTINASSSSGSEVEIRVEKIAKARSDEAAREFLKQIQIVEDSAPNRVRLETKVPKRLFGGMGHEVRYWVKVPKGLAVNFETVNGAVRLENLDGQVEASTTNGGVRGVGLSGAVNASTTNGGVQIEMAAVTADIKVETTNGGVQLQLPRDAKASLEARCTNGGIKVSDFDLQGGESSRRRLTGDINGGGPKVVAETTNGAIRISAAGRSETH